MHSRHCCPHTHGPQSHLPNAGLSPYSRLTSSRLLSNMSKGLVNLAASAEAGPSPAQPASPAVRAAPPSGCWAPPHACLGVLAGQRASPPTPLACVWAFLPFATLVSLLRQQQKSLHRVAVSRPPVLYSALIPGFPGDSVVALTPLPPLLWGPAPLHPGRAHLPATPSHTSGGSLPPSGPRCQAPALPVLGSRAPQPSTSGWASEGAGPSSQLATPTLSSPGLLWFPPLCANSIQTGRHPEAPVRALLSAKGSRGSREGPRSRGRSSSFQPQRASHRWHRRPWPSVSSGTALSAVTLLSAASCRAARAHGVSPPSGSWPSSTRGAPWPSTSQWTTRW